MRQHYSIARNADGEWVVRAEGRDLLLCARKSDALKAANDAKALSQNLASGAIKGEAASPSTSPIRRKGPLTV